VKTKDQQATLMPHRLRDRLVGQRRATINALRGHLTELGIVAALRQAGVRQLPAHGDHTCVAAQIGCGADSRACERQAGSTVAFVGRLWPNW
jgi:transposase